MLDSWSGLGRAEAVGCIAFASAWGGGAARGKGARQLLEARSDGSEGFRERGARGRRTDKS